MGKLKNKIALITGGNSGIGLATARRFQQEGAKVIITARSNETYEKAKKELTGFDVIQADVRNLTDLDQLYSTIKTKYGKLDVLFANAGIANLRPTSDVDVEHFDSQFDTNVKGLYFTVAKALPLLSPGSSVILNASAIQSKGLPGGSVYAATKAAVRSFARTWTAEIPHDLARFNVLSPGPIETPIQDKMGLGKEQKDAFTETVTNTVPARRFGKPEEMANVALFLASDDSSYIRGADIFADGGFGQV